MTWRTDLVELIDQAALIASGLRNDPLKPEPNIAMLDNVVVGLETIRQKILDFHLPAPNGRTTLGVSRAVLDFIFDRDGPLVRACGAVEHCYLTIPPADPNQPTPADFTQIQLHTDGSTTPIIQDGQALIAIEQGQVTNIGLWRDGWPIGIFDVPINDHGLGKEAVEALTLIAPERLTQTNRAYLMCPASLTELMVWPSDHIPRDQGANNPQIQTARDAFLDFWVHHYPETPPISYLFKHHLNKRWARIHSLPESKRYAQTPEEWRELKRRHNAIIDHLIPQRTQIRVVTNYLDPDNYIFKAFAPVVVLGNFGIAGEDEPQFSCFEFRATWESNSLNPLLTMIAQDKMRAFIIGADCLIAPYDGGIDVILPDPQTCLAFKLRFSDWLSKRDDGL